MSEKNHQDQEYDQYATDSDEMESIDQNEYASRSDCIYQGDERSHDDYMNDSPCVTTCCCCCSLGLGSIIAGVLFMVLNGIYIGRQMNNLGDAMTDTEVSDLSFNDGHLDAIFAFVGIALAGIGGLCAFILTTLSCCCGVAEHVQKIKIGAFSWTVATGLSSIWVLGEALYRTIPNEETTVTKGLGYIIINDINNVENPQDDQMKQLIITWIIAGSYILLYLYLSVVVMSFVHVLSRTSVLTQSEQLAKKQGIKKSGSPDISVHSDTTLLQRYPSYAHTNQAFQNGGDRVETITEQIMAAQNFPELMQQQQQHQDSQAQLSMQQMGGSLLPPMFQETIVMGPNGDPINVVIDPNGQIVPPEIVQQILMQQAQQMNQQMMAHHIMNQSECNSVITDVTYRSGAPLMSNQVGGGGGPNHGHSMAPQMSMSNMINMMQQNNNMHQMEQRPMERTRSVRFDEKPETRYIEPDSSSSEEEDKKGVRFSLYTEEVEVSPYPAEQ